MQLRHVRYFVATAAAGSVSAAAVAVRVSQPALSRQLRQLEQDLGADLFERGTGRLALSRTGRAVLPAARRLLAAADELAGAARYHARGGLERITIAAPTVTLTDVVSPYVATMSPEDPVVDVSGADGLTTADMLRGGADLAIGIQRPPEPYRSIALAELPVWAYAPPAGPLAGRESIALEELLARPLIVLPATFTAREALESAVRSAGRSYAEVIEAANGTIAQALAASGRGVAVVSDDPRYGLMPLRVETGAGALTIRLRAAWDTRGVAAPGVARLAERLGAWVRERYGVGPG